MAKHIKLRLSRFLNSCRSKHDPSILPSNPVPSFLRLPHASPALSHPPAVDHPPSKQHFHWKQDDDFHVISLSNPNKKSSPRKKVSFSDTLFTPPRPSLAERIRRRRIAARKKNHSNTPNRFFPRVSFSTSSTDSGVFTTSDDFIEKRCRSNRLDVQQQEETETLVSFSSSEDGHDSSKPTRQKPKRRENMKKKKKKRKVRGLMKGCETEVEMAARLSVVERGRGAAMAMRWRKVRESYVVVKRTEDPYGEFKRSMMEMVTEKEMFEEEELKQMLRCLLSLNDREHHRVIVDAFVEIWDALFRKRRSMDLATVF